MTQLEDIKKEFEVGAFQKVTSLTDKVEIIVRFQQKLKDYIRRVAKEKGLEGIVKIIVGLTRSLNERAKRAVKKIDQDFEKIAQQSGGESVFTSEKAAEFENSEKSKTITKGMLLVDKVRAATELRREFAAQKKHTAKENLGEEFKNKVKIIARLMHNLKGRMNRAVARIAQDFEKIAQQYGGEGVFINVKATEFENSKKSQITTENKIFEQNRQEKISVPVDRTLSEHASVIEVDTTGKAVSEDKNFEQKNISVQKPLVQPSVSKDPIDVSGGSPGAFSEGTSLANKVKNANELHQGLKAYKRSIAKEKGLEGKVKIITMLLRSLSRRAKRADRRIDKDFEKIVELNRKLKDVFPENSSLEDKVKIIVELHQELKAQKGHEDEVKILAKLIQNLEDRMDRGEKRISQDLKKIPEFNLQYKGKSVFTSEKAVKFEGGQTTTEDKSFKQKEISVQKPLVQPSVSKDPIKDKPSDKKPQLSKKQENQEEGFLSRFKRFINKMLGKDKKNMEDMKGAAQENTSSSEVQKENELFLSQDQNVNESLKQPAKLDDPSITSKTNTERER